VDCNERIEGPNGQTGMTAAIRKWAPPNVLHMFLNKGADCNPDGEDSDAPLYAYLEHHDLTSIDKSLLERLLIKTHVRDYVFRSICQCILLTYGPSDTPEIQAKLKCLMGHLPGIQLNSIEIAYPRANWPTYPLVMMQGIPAMAAEITINQCDALSFAWRKRTRLYATCCLLLETCSFRNQVTITTSCNDWIIEGRDKMFGVEVDMKLEMFIEAASQPDSLQKLCILCIRQNMPSKLQHDFNQLALPSQLKVLVTFEHMAFKLQEMLSKRHMYI
jgi:hypothetical protein